MIRQLQGISRVCAVVVVVAAIAATHIKIRRFVQLHTYQHTELEFHGIFFSFSLSICKRAGKAHFESFVQNNGDTFEYIYKFNAIILLNELPFDGNLKWPNEFSNRFPVISRSGSSHDFEITIELFSDCHRFAIN